MSMNLLWHHVPKTDQTLEAWYSIGATPTAAIYKHHSDTFILVLHGKAKTFSTLRGAQLAAWLATKGRE